jgi:threonine/homoserine/homoserine lactone efflux protein
MSESLIAFLGAAVLIALAPGPSTVMILRQSVTSRRAGAVTVLGNETGVLLWGLAAAFGLSAVLVASRVAYDGMRLLGAGVLIWFGARALWQVRRRGGERTDVGAPSDVVAEVVAVEGSLWRSYRLGVLTNLANPKAGVFAVSFLPQFVPDGAPVLATLVLFSVLWAVIDSIWYLGIVWLVGRVREVVERPSVRRRLEQVSGVVLVGLGIRLATETR